MVLDLAGLKKNKLFSVLMVALFILLKAPDLHSESLKVAVASNFSSTLKALQADFELKTGHRLVISEASSGKLYAQIAHGAPYDIFLSADSKRADLLTASGLAFDSAVYAQGQLMLIINTNSGVNCGSSIQNAMSNSNLNKLAVANSKIAPYGAAAEEFIKESGNWKELSGKLVRGENVLQVLHFVSSGNAGAGLIAKSLLLDFKEPRQYCRWHVPQHFYQPVIQKMVILKSTKKLALARKFSDYIKSDSAKRIIINNGYIVK